MSAKNQLKQNQKNVRIHPIEQIAQRKDSLDPLLKCQMPPLETPTELSKLNKINPMKANNFSKIEHWETTPSKDGMKINLMLNINFNLKGIMVTICLFLNFL
jgi:hypothetical protein